MASPIESALCTALRQLGVIVSDEKAKVNRRTDAPGFELVVDGEACTAEEFAMAEVGDDEDPPPFLALTEVVFLGYRIDILLVSVYGEAFLAIECDGHKFHERTKQQASSDRARDRAMLINGMPVVRFTGSDIHRDSNQCAKECVDLAHQIDVSRQGEWSSAHHAGYARAIEDMFPNRKSPSSSDFLLSGYFPGFF